MGEELKGNGRATAGSRRLFLRRLLRMMAAGASFDSLWRMRTPAWAGMKPGVVLPPGTDPRSLVDRNPRTLDTRNLEVMPLSDFKTMGLSDHRVDAARWRLQVDGQVATPLQLSLAELRGFTPVTRNVLLICPGVFCNHGRWQGVSLAALLKAASAPADATHVRVEGPAGPYRKTHQVTLAAVKADRAILAYAVNGETLPVAHGFPLRLVSEGDYGFDWVKYVDHVQVVRVDSARDTTY